MATAATFPMDGYVRIDKIISYFGISRATWYKWIRMGKAPKPTKLLGSAISAWRAQDVRSIMDSQGAE